MEDYWIVDWIYVEQKSVTSFANSQTPLLNTQRVPLAYPYGNSQREADRFTRDLKEWLDCRGICYKDDEPHITQAFPTGVGSAYPSDYGLRVSVTVFGIEFVNMYYSRNAHEYGSEAILRSGTKTTVSSICDQPFDLYRRVSTGHAAWGINFKGELELPPYTGLLTKVSCDFMDNRKDDCDRPSGSTEVYVSALDTQICNYNLRIPTNVDITSVWMRGVNMISGAYEPDGTGSSGKDVQDLTDTINDYIQARNGMGQYAINNRYGTNYGWFITGKWTNYPIDSIVAGGNKYYPTRNGCATYKTFYVQRNDLGGILHCKDELGMSAYLTDDAIKIPPGMENSIFMCENHNRFGHETVLASTTKIFQLKNYHYFSYAVLEGSTVTVEAYNYAGSPISFTAPVGYSENFTATPHCNLLSGYVAITCGSGSTVKVSYIW